MPPRKSRYNPYNDYWGGRWNVSLRLAQLAYLSKQRKALLARALLQYALRLRRQRLERLRLRRAFRKTSKTPY